MTARADIGLVSIVVVGCFGLERTVDAHLGVANDLLDLALLLEVGKALTGEAAVDLVTVDEGGNGDQAVGLDILVELLGGGLVEDDGVLGLVLDCIEVSKSIQSKCDISFSPRLQTIVSSFCPRPAKVGPRCSRSIGR